MAIQMQRQYTYLGSHALKELLQRPAQRRNIRQPNDVRQWIKNTEQTLEEDNTVIATFIIDLAQQLWIADRHSEHVVCARGEKVLSAGEMTFMVGEREIEVLEVTNQSTGYCPEPESWWAVTGALERIGLPHPTTFTTAYLFRRCDQCGQTNIVKDMWFECGVCQASLNQRWNFDVQPAK